MGNTEGDERPMIHNRQPRRGVAVRPARHAGEGLRNAPHWLQLVFCLTLGALLVSCSRSPAEPSPLPPSPSPMPPTPQPTATPAPQVGLRSEYRLALSLDPTNRRLVGQQQVTFPNHTGQDLPEIVFRLYPNLPQYGGRIDVGAAWVDGQQSAASLRTEDTSLVVPLPRPLKPGSSVVVVLDFEVQIPEKEPGYALFGFSQGIWSLPDAYPLLAVHDGSIWHEDLAPADFGDAVFADAAHYDVTLTLPPALTLITTGSVVDDTLDAAGQRLVHIVDGPLREFAFLASADYLLAETVADGITLRSYYLPGDEAAGQETLTIAAAALQAYEDAFGPYPFAGMTVAEAPLLH